MNQYVFLAIIAVLQLFRGIYLWLGKKSTNFIWISLFLVCVPFTFEKVIELNNSENINSGTLGSSYKITFALIMERILNKVDHLLSNLRDECYMSAVNNVNSLVQKDLGTTTMMTKIDQELSQLRNKVNHLTLSMNIFIET